MPRAWAKDSWLDPGNGSLKTRNIFFIDVSSDLVWSGVLLVLPRLFPNWDILSWSWSRGHDQVRQVPVEWSAGHRRFVSKGYCNSSKVGIEQHQPSCLVNV